MFLSFLKKNCPYSPKDNRLLDCFRCRWISWASQIASLISSSEEPQHLRRICFRSIHPSLSSSLFRLGGRSSSYTLTGTTLVLKWSHPMEMGGPCEHSGLSVELKVESGGEWKKVSAVQHIPQAKILHFRQRSHLTTQNYWILSNF